jgi:hypothetical protein
MIALSRPDSCLSDLTLDAWSSGELDTPASAQAAAHVTTCERCARRRADMDAVRADFYADAASFSAHAARYSAPHKPVRARGKLLGLGGAFLGLAAAFALLWLPSQPGNTRQKGGPSFGYFVKRGARVFEGDRNTRVQAGDLIRFTYSTVSPRYLAVFSWDSHEASLYFPEGTRAQRVQSELNVGLDFSVELDAEPSPEQVHALFCNERYELTPLLEALRSTGQLPVPTDCQDVVVTLHKALTP